MSSTDWHYIRKKPRHAVSDEKPILVQVERLGDLLPKTLEARLVDFSRQGARIYVRFPLPRGERIALTLGGDGVPMTLTVTGTVRWLQPLDDELWAAGCQFESEVSMETLGELFLHEILSIEMA